MVGTEPEIVAKKDGKKTRLGIHWKNGWINFCSIQFLKDGSMVFSSKFHNSAPNIDIGSARQFKEGFTLHTQSPERHELDNGCHITLHPKGQSMHLRKNSSGEILETRKINWFPVTVPFNLLTLYSLPLDLCPFDKRQPNFYAPFPDEYTNSVQVVVDVFPRQTTEHFPNQQSVWIYWGYCPDYFVRVSFNRLEQRTPALLYWPKDSNLSL
jgi:hypothetical protein